MLTLNFDFRAQNYKKKFKQGVQILIKVYKFQQNRCTNFNKTKIVHP